MFLELSYSDVLLFYLLTTYKAPWPIPAHSEAHNCLTLCVRRRSQDWEETHHICSSHIISVQESAQGS